MFTGIVEELGRVVRLETVEDSARLTVEALVGGRRAKVSGYSGGSGRRNSTAYYVTFEVASDDRMELRLSGSEYGMLAEGDRGQLSFQGTRYLGFERRIG